MNTDVLQPLSPGLVADAIQTALVRILERERRTPAAHPYVYASAARVCTKRMVHELIEPEKQPAYSTDTLARFRRGNDRERDLLIDLARVGREADPAFDVVAQQERFELRDRKGRVAIVGKVDARLKVHGTTTSAPIEVKSWSPMIVDRLRTFDDVFDNPWTRAGGNQLLAYLYGSNEHFGFLLLDRSGLPLLLPVVLEHHLDRMETFLTNAETALDHVAAGTLPPYLVGDAAECQRCPFYGGTCNPPLAHAGAVVLDDPDLESLLEEWEAVRVQGQEFNRIDRKVKERLRGVEHGVCGPFAITGAWGKYTRVDVPADIKRQYTTVDPQGRFTLDIVKF